MKTKDTLMVRYMGPDHARRFVIQRADEKFWTGEGFDPVLDRAKIFTDHKTAQTTATAIQYKKYKGKPLRKFKLEMEVTLVADDANGISLDTLIQFLANTMRIDMETSLHGDGPVEGSLVQARAKIATLEEVAADRRTF